MTKHLPPPVTAEETVIETRARPRKGWIPQILRRQKNCCAGCGAKLVTGKFDWDHFLALALGGLNTIVNFQALCGPCHKIKTAEDFAKIAKTKRHQKKRRVAHGEIEARTKPTIQGQGFHSGNMKRTVSGQVVPRERVNQDG